MRFRKNAISLFSVTFGLMLAMDGSVLAQVSADSLIRVTAVRDAYPYWSPDGKQIVFQSDRNSSMHGDFQIYIMNADGSKIVWRRLLPTGGSAKSGRNSEIFIMNRDGSNPVNLTNHPDFDGYPSWSPDGSKIVFASNRERKEEHRGNFHIYIMNADGSGVTKVLDNDGLIEDARPVWSPDGSRILFNRQYIADESSMDIMIIKLPEELAVSTSDK